MSSRSPGPNLCRFTALLALALAASSVTALIDASAAPAKLEIKRDLTYGKLRAARLDVLATRRGPAVRPAVMVIHGGAWVARTKKATAPLARRLAVHGFVAINVNFTSARTRRPGFPLQLRQLRKAVRYVRSHAAALGVDPTRIGAYGVSSGAHLAALLATTGKGPLTRGARVRALVGWGGLYSLNKYNGSPKLRGRMETFLGCYPCPRRAGEASPLSHVSREDPAMMIVHSTDESVPLSDARRMADRLRANGVPRQLRVLSGVNHRPLDSPGVFRHTVSYLKDRLRPRP